MAYFPSQLQTQPQVLWQPVIVQQLQNQTIQQLRRQNDYLKHHLSQVLKTEKTTRSFQNSSSHFAHLSGRQSFYPQNNGNFTKRPIKNACFSPRLQTHENRFSLNRTSGLRPYFSPKETNQTSNMKENIFEEQTKLKRMVISKGKDGKYYRDLHKENQQNQSIENNKTTNKFSTAQNSQIFSGFTTPTRKSKQMNEMLKSSIQQKQNLKRLKSPSFLKKNLGQETENERFRTSLIAKLKQQLTMEQNQPVFKRSHQVQQSIIESQSQKQSKNQEIKQAQQPCKKLQPNQQKAQRKQCRVPTLELSYECDSNLSIQRMLRQAKRQKKSRKFSNCDLFLRQIEQNLDAMYGNHQKK